MPEYKTWQQVLNTADGEQTAADFASGSETEAPPRSVLGLCGFGMNERQFGARLTADGDVVSAVGAGGKTCRSAAGEAVPACGAAATAGFRADIPGVTAGARYKFRIDGEIDVPDPASAFQPDDVFGPSEVIDHASYRLARRRTGAGGHGTRRSCSKAMSAPSRRKAPIAP